MEGKNSAVPTADELRIKYNADLIGFMVIKVLPEHTIINVVETVTGEKTSLIQDDVQLIASRPNLEVNKVYFVDQSGLIKPE